MSFDLAIAFDKTKYLDYEIKLFIDSLKGKLPKDSVLHVNTNRSRKSETIQYIRDNVESKIYINQKPDLISRCGFLLNAFKVKSDKDFVIKFDVDNLFLKPLNEFDKYLNKDKDVYIIPENRRVVRPDIAETRLWRIMYRAMKIKMGEDYVTSLESKEQMRPLYNTGVIAASTNILDTINKDWEGLTKICERWIMFNIHPNEFAFTALMYKHNWKRELLPEIFNWNPISHFRNGNFPSTKLIDNPKLPDDIVAFHYHKPMWLHHILGSNDLGINRNDFPKSWLSTEDKIFQERLIR